VNRDTILALHDVKQAMLQQQTIDLREIGVRIDAAKAERDDILNQLARGQGEETVSSAIIATQYRTFQKGALERVALKIEAIAKDYAEAEEALTTTFAEVRAIERLMQG